MDDPSQLQSSAAAFLDYGKCQATLIIGFATSLSCNYIINIVSIVKLRMKALSRTSIYLGLPLICMHVKFSYIKKPAVIRAEIVRYVVFPEAYASERTRF